MGTIIKNGNIYGGVKSNQFNEQEFKIENNVVSLKEEYLTIDEAVNKENLNNKVTSLSSSNTDTQYPSAKAVYNTIANMNAEIDGKVDNDVFVADNIIKFPYYFRNQETKGVTFNALDNGNVTASGVVSDRFSFVRLNSQNNGQISIEHKKYILSGCPAGGGNDKYAICVLVGPASATYVALQNAVKDVGSGVVIDNTDGSYDSGISLVVTIFETGTTVENITFRPMLEEGTTKHDYQPYNLSRQALRDDINANKITVDSSMSSNSTNPVQNKVVKDEIDKKENSLNKVTSLSSSSTDIQYPSAKAVYDELSTKVTKDEKIVIKTTAMDVSKGKPVQETGSTEIYKDGIAISNPATKNDAGWIRVTGTDENDTVLEIATGDDSGKGETIMFRGYGTAGIPNYQVEVPKGNGTLVLEEVIENNNLLTYPYYCFQQITSSTLTSEGLTAVLREDGTILLNGAYTINDETLPNLNLSLTDNNFVLKKGKTYTVSHNLNITGVRIRFESIDPPQPLEDMDGDFVFNVAQGGTRTKTISQDIRGRFYLSIAHRDKDLDGKTEPLTFNNVEFKPMVELSIKAHDFITPKISSEAINLYYNNGAAQPCELVTYNALKQYYQRHDTVKVYGGLGNNYTALSLGGQFNESDTVHHSDGRIVLYTNTEKNYTIAIKPDNTIQSSISVFLPKTNGTLALDNLVTRTNKGLMDSADKIKLDNLTPVRKILTGGIGGANNALIYDPVNNTYSYNELCMFSGNANSYAKLTLGGVQTDNTTTTYKRGLLELYDTNNNKGELQYNNGSFTSNQNKQINLGSNSLYWKTGWFVDLQTSTINGTSADYSEMFEWSDGNIYNDDRRGLFVVYDKENVKSDKDIMIKVFDYQKDSIDDIVGIVSSSPLIVGDSDGEEWINKYEHDEFGKIKTTLEKEPAIYLKTYPAEYDKEGNLIRDEYTEETTEKTDKLYKEESYKEVPILNPNYNSDLKYVPRKERKEWDCIGFMGKIVMVDDGTCKIGSYVKPTEDNTGRATYSDSRTNFTAIKRIDDTHIKVLVK